MTSRLAALFRYNERAAARRVTLALRRSSGRIDKAAERLGVSYRTLHRLLRRYRLEKVPTAIRAGVKQ